MYVDDFLIKEIKQRLWEQKFERQTHENYYKQMQQLVTDGMEMQKQLLQYRLTARKNIAHQAFEDERKIKTNENAFLQSLEGSKSAISGKKQGNNNQGRKSSSNSKIGENKINNGFILSKNQPKTWDETWSIINSRTGITDPDIFFHRINNG